KDRSNLAVYNLGGEPVTLRITVFSGAGDGASAIVRDAETLPAYGWTQYSGVLNGTGITQGFARVEALSSGARFSAYGVVNDNTPSDGSFLFPVALAAAQKRLTVPVVVETASFRSELILANGGRTAVDLALDYRESLSPGAGAGGVAHVHLAPGEQRAIP